MKARGAAILHRINRPELCWGLAFWPFLIALAALLLAPLTARAQDDAPARVGRIANYGGQLLLAPDDRASEWAPIGLNYPITSGDNLWVSGEGRAEVDFGAGQFRLAGDTNLHISRLDDHEISLFIAQGRAIIRLARARSRRCGECHTPNTQIVLTRAGLYRIDVSDDRQQTTIVVREGRGCCRGRRRHATDPAGSDGHAIRHRQCSGRRAQRHGSRRVRHLERRPRPVLLAKPERELCLARNGRLRRSRHLWRMAKLSGLRRGLVPDLRGRRLGAVPPWPVGVAAFLGLDLGRRGALGLRAVPLRSLGAYRGPLGLVPGRLRRASGVSTGALVAWYGGSGWGLSTSVGAPVYGWVPLGWREPYFPSWRNCGSRCMTAYNKPYAVNVAERPAAAAHLRQPRGAGCDHRGRRRDIRRRQAGGDQPRQRSRTSGSERAGVECGAAGEAAACRHEPQCDRATACRRRRRTIQATTKPMSIRLGALRVRIKRHRRHRNKRRVRSRRCRAAPAVPVKHRTGYHREAPPGSVPNRAAPASNAAEQSQRFSRPAMNAPMAVPGAPGGGRPAAVNADAAPSGASVPIPPPRGPQGAIATPQGGSVNSAPPARFRGPPAQDANVAPPPQQPGVKVRSRASHCRPRCNRDPRRSWHPRLRQGRRHRPSVGPRRKPSMWRPTRTRAAQSRAAKAHRKPGPPKPQPSAN